MPCIRPWPRKSRIPAAGGSALGIVAGAPPVDDDDRLVADHPGVVPWRKRGHLAGARVELGAVGQLDAQSPGDVVLEVRGLAQVGARDRLDVTGPAPPGLEHQAAYVAAADVQQLDLAVGEGADLVGA